MDHNVNKSIKGFNWILHELDSNYRDLLSNKLELNKIIIKSLVRRNIKENKIKEFLNPTLREELPDPFHLIDMNKGASILAEGIIKREKIVIFGDYDVDGATSSALLKNFLSLLNIDCDIYIPDRIKEGYGPNIKAFSCLKDKGANIIVTVDCGTASAEAIKFGVNNGLKIIVVDHHLSDDILPPAHALINPNRKDETSKFTYLAAVGVTFLLIIAIMSILRKKKYFLNKKEPSLLNLLDIVAIGTICDVVPLEALNRAFVIQGLKILNKKNNLGIATLCQLLNLDDSKLTSYHLGYVIGPRINAGGRVGEPYLGANLLSTNSHKESLNISQQLNIYNEERKAIEYDVYKQAVMQAKNLSRDDALIMVSGESWHPGVIGIVAGRLKESFNKPTIILSLDSNYAKASCRSIFGIDMGLAIIEARKEKIIEGGGGHKMAAGFTILREKIPELKAFLQHRFTKELAMQKDLNNRSFDSYLTIDAINLSLANDIERIGPFGSGNSEPRYILKNVYIAKANIFANEHIGCFVGCSETRDLTKLLKANAFRSVDTEIGNILLNNSHQNLNLVGCIRINRWRNRETPEFTIEDIILDH